LADIFGLGALLWSLATGSVPRAPIGEDELAALPQAIAIICGKCLAFDPRQRFQSTAELVERLNA
jgi:hypothetical protein